MLKGNNMILSLDGKRLAASRGCSIDRNTDTIEVCSPVDGPAKRYIPTTTGWSIAASGLYATAEGAEVLRNLWRKYQQGGEQTLIHVRVTSEGVAEEGDAILTSLHEDGNYNELVKFSIQLQGSGKLDCTYLPMTKYEQVYNDINIKVVNGELEFDNETTEQDEYEVHAWEMHSDAPAMIRIRDNADNHLCVIVRGKASTYSFAFYNKIIGPLKANMVSYTRDTEYMIHVPAGDYVVYFSNSQQDHIPTFEYGV